MVGKRLEYCFSNINVQTTHPGNLIKMQILMQWIWTGTCESDRLRGFQVMPRLLILLGSGDIE